jgi:LCP family protein required for cell wall assembly
MTHDADGSAPLHARGRSPRILLAIAASVALIISVGSAYALVTYVRVENVGTTSCFYDTVGCPKGPPGARMRHAVGPCINDACNYLLLGSDSRSGLTSQQQTAFGSNRQAGAGLNSDVVMLVHADPNLEKAIILSFPRDLWVRIPGHGHGKINSSFGLGGGISGGGPQLVARTVSALTGLTINHYLYVDLDGFEGVVKALGGVDMCIAAENVNTPGPVETENADGSVTQVYYREAGHIVDPRTGLDVTPGCHRLDPTQALAYVRTRHLRCDATAPDFFRIGRQQQFFRAVLNRLMQPDELLRAPSLIGPVLSNMRRDERLVPADLAYLVGQLRGVGTADVEFRSIPASPFTTHEGLDALRMEPSAERIFQAIKGGAPLGGVGVTPTYTPPSPANIVVRVVDHASEGRVQDVERVVSEGGFTIPTPATMAAADYGAKAKGSEIAYAPGHLVEAKVVQQFLPSLRLREVKDLPDPDHVAVFVTTSYRPAEIGAGDAGATSAACLGPTG